MYDTLVQVLNDQAKEAENASRSKRRTRNG
jgi:hypothetical protein